MLKRVFLFVLTNIAILAIMRDIASEISAPPMPQTRQKTARASIRRPPGPR